MAYKIKSGDTLSQIAKDNNTTVAEIVNLNPSIKNPNLIYAGTEINLPSSGTSASVPSSAGSTSLKGNSSGNSASGVQMKSPYLGVSDQAYTDYMNSAYTRSDGLQSIYNQADALLEQYQNTTNGERQQKINSIVEEYENMDPFSYDFATDPMFQNMLASYQQMGQSAMKDSIAQSSALTGGYANSWAQTAGQQSYNRHIQEAFNNLPSYYQMALETYRQEGQKLLDMYGLLDSEQQKELDQILNQHGIIYGKARDFESDERNDYSTNLTKQWNDIALSNSEAWNNKNYKYQMEQDAIANARAEKQLEAELLSSGITYDDNGNMVYTGTEDEDDFQKYVYAGNTEDGRARFYRDGKEYVYDIGLNPYTGTTNYDAEGGDTFDNGYQPKNINGQPLTWATEDGLGLWTDDSNGVVQRVWQTPDGKRWRWDGTINQYVEHNG